MGIFKQLLQVISTKVSQAGLNLVILALDLRFMTLFCNYLLDPIRFFLLLFKENINIISQAHGRRQRTVISESLGNIELDGISCH